MFVTKVWIHQRNKMCPSNKHISKNQPVYLSGELQSPYHLIWCLCKQIVAY